MFKKTNKNLLILLCLVFCLALVACSNSNENTSSESTSGAAGSSVSAPVTTAEASDTKNNEKAFDQDTPIVIASYRDVGRGNEDPYWTNLNLYVWEPLIGENNAGEIIPMLATSWEKSEDAKKWSFVLREGVEFSDGTKFNADVVLKNFERWKKISPASSTFFSLDINKTYPGLLEINKTGDYSFELVFENPIPTLPYTMLNWGSAMVSPTCFDEQTGIFNKYVVGTGQFKLIEHVPEQYTMLERYDNYWGEKAKAKYIKVRMIPDHDTRVAALRSGEIQAVYDNRAIQPLACKELEKEGFNISSQISANIHYLMLNCNKFPFNDVRMRQAVSLAVDRETLLDDLYGGYGQISSNVLSPFSVFYVETPHKRDLEKAKSLVNEVLGGKKLEISLISRDQYKLDAQLIVANLQEIGIDAKIEIMEWPAQKKRTQAGEFDIAMSFKGMNNADPATMFKMFMHKDGFINKGYGMLFYDEECNNLVDELAQTFDIEKRKELYLKLQQISAEKVPIVTLFGVDTTVASSPDISGYDAKWTGVTLYNVKWNH